jgi:hypothetical protein
MLALILAIQLNVYLCRGTKPEKALKYIGGKLVI